MDINVFFEQLNTTFAGGNIADVCALFEKSIATAQAENDTHSLITILNEKAGFYRNISKYGDAVQAAERALGLMASLGYEGTIPYGTTLLNTGTAYRAAGNPAKALDCFSKTLAIFQKNLDANDHRMAGLFNNMGAAYQEMEEHEKALEMIEKAIPIMRNNEAMRADTVVVLGNLAVTQIKLGKETEAQATLQQARAIMDNGAISGKSHEYAVAFAATGEVLYRAGRYAESIEAFESAMKLVKDAFGENRDYATLCFNCADAYDKLECTDKASAYIKKGKETLEFIGVDI